MKIFFGPSVKLRIRLLPIVRLVVYLACGLISAFILASGYESVYNKPVPFIHTLAKVDLTTLAKSYDLKEAAVLKTSIYGDFGKPVKLTIPSATSSLRLSIVTPIADKSNWLARASTMHMLIPTKPRSGNISTEILYCRAGFRTIIPSALPATGSNLFIDTDKNWRYVYKVTLAKNFANTYPYVPTGDSTKGKLIIFCSDPANAANVVIEGDIISVQAVTQ